MTRAELIEKCALENIRFPGMGDSKRYNVADLFQTGPNQQLSKDTLVDMCTRIWKKLEDKAKGPFASDTFTEAEQRMQIQVDVLKEAVQHRKDLAAAETATKAKRKAAKEELANIKAVREEKTIEDYRKKSGKVLDARIAELEAELAGE